MATSRLSPRLRLPSTSIRSNGQRGSIQDAGHQVRQDRDLVAVPTIQHDIGISPGAVRLGSRCGRTGMDAKHNKGAVS